MPRGKKRIDAEIKRDNEAYLRTTKSWPNFSYFPYVTIREAAFLLDITPAEVERQIAAGIINVYRVRYMRGRRIWTGDLNIYRYPEGVEELIGFLRRKRT